MKKVITILLLLLSFITMAQKIIPVKATDEELKLFAMINAYRKENGLKEIPFSSALTHVAQTHCKDWQSKKPIKLHDWNSCKFDITKEDTYGCMWYKPQELTTYKGYGYECAHAVFGGPATAESAFNGWKNSPPHNNTILNIGMWKDIEWNALGIGIYKDFACIWFGHEPDNQ